MRLIFLGTGTSFGVPQIGCGCAVCHSPDPRDRRTRCGAVIEVDHPSGDAGRRVRLLIDTPPELRLQLVTVGVASVDGVLYTHEHADHIHGIDDLRAITVHRPTPLPLYGDAATLATLATRFPYVVDEQHRPLPGTTRPQGRCMPVTAGVPFAVHGVSVFPCGAAWPHIGHGLPCRRYRLCHRCQDAASGCSRGAERGSRADPECAIAHVSSVTPVRWRSHCDGAACRGRAHLLHPSRDNSHAALAAELPAGIAPAYDGLVVELPETARS